MSSVDRISVNRSEPNYPLEEERKRQLARRLQLESRNIKRLVLPPIESQSRLAAKRALDGRRQSGGLAESGTYAGQDTDVAYGLDPELAALAIAVSDPAPSGKDKDSQLPPRFLGRQTVPRGKDANLQSRVDQKGSARSAAMSDASAQQEADVVAKKTSPRDANASDAEERADARVRANFSWLQKLDAAVAEGRASLAKNVDHSLENVLDELLNELQARAADAEPLTADLKAALDALASNRIGSLISDSDFANRSRLQGSYRFLEAFVESMEGKSADRVATGSRIDPAADPAGPSQLAETASAPDKKGDAVAMQTNEDAQQTVTPARDRQTLYEYLELLSQVAASGSPFALQQLKQARKSNPQEALRRLAAAGDQAVMLFTPEISRRYDLISARLEREGKKSARASMLAEAVATERQWMQSVMDQVDSMAGTNAIGQRSEREQRDKNLGETLPQLVLQKT